MILEGEAEVVMPSVFVDHGHIAGMDKRLNSTP